MTSAGPQAAIFDTQHRPITAGGFVKTGPSVFIDVTEKAILSSHFCRRLEALEH